MSYIFMGHESCHIHVCVITHMYESIAMSKRNGSIYRSRANASSALQGAHSIEFMHCIALHSIAMQCIELMHCIALQCIEHIALH